MILFHRNLHIPKLKYHFQGHRVKGGNLSLETALLLNYVSQPRAFPEVLAIYCSDAVSKDGGEKGGQIPGLPPKPKTLSKVKRFQD